MRKRFQTFSHYLYLVPLFFVMHSAGTYAEGIPLSHQLLLVVVYMLTFHLLLLPFYFLYKVFWKASLAVFILQMIFFFFADAHLYLRNHTPVVWISQYRYFLSATIVMTGLCMAVIYRHQTKPEKFILLLNGIFFLFIITDLIQFRVLQSSGNPVSVRQMDDEEAIELVHKPSIYLLVFDEYASSSSLRTRFNYQNNLDSFLLEKKFHLVKNSRSNYNFTPFSIASLLNFSYLEGLNPENITSSDYRHVQSLIRENKLVALLEKNGYTILNKSIFDFKSQPAFSESVFLPEELELIRRQTFFRYVYQDLGWLLLRFRSVFSSYYLRTLLQSKKQNEQISHAILQTTKSDKNKPVFLYAHMNMPHAPYYFDSYGRERPVDSVAFENKHQIDKPETYLSYLTYTNTVIKKMVEDILMHEKGEAIVVIAGDHGYRSNTTQPDQLFENMNAVYLPEFLPVAAPAENMTLVNEFRFILNAISRKPLQMLSDSTILLIDKKPENRDKN